MKKLIPFVGLLLAGYAVADAEPRITSMPQLEQQALTAGKGEMTLPGESPIRIKAFRQNYIADTGCAFVAVSYIYSNPSVDAPNRIGVYETVSPVCPAGNEGSR